MATITCPKCQVTAECGEVESGEYQLSYNFLTMVPHCQEIHRRQQTGEPFGCSEMEKATSVFINKKSASKAVLSAKKALAKAMHTALAKDNAALAKAVQRATETKSRPRPSRQRATNDRQPDWDGVHKANYVTKLTLRQNWFREANKLLAAAEFLASPVTEWWEGMKAWHEDKEKTLPEHEHEFQTTYMMLCAYAIENFCKGWLAAQLPGWERERLERKGKLPKSLEGHDLFKLVEKIGMPLIDHDEELLRRLACCAVWRGRYPVPLYYREREAEFKDGKRYSLEILGAEDIPRIKDLVQRLRQHVNAPDTYRVPLDQRDKEEEADESE